MRLLLPSDNDNGTMSSVSKAFETSRFFTIAEIADDTVSFTQVRKGFESPPTAQKWVDVIRKLKVDAVVVDSISAGTAAALGSAHIRLITGARGLTGMLLDWAANLGLDDFESKINALNAPPVPPPESKPSAAQPVQAQSAKQQAPVAPKTQAAVPEDTKRSAD